MVRETLKREVAKTRMVLPAVTLLEKVAASPPDVADAACTKLADSPPEVSTLRFSHTAQLYRLLVDKTPIVGSESRKQPRIPVVGPAPLFVVHPVVR